MIGNSGKISPLPLALQNLRGHVKNVPFEEYAQCMMNTDPKHTDLLRADYATELAEYGGALPHFLCEDEA